MELQELMDKIQKWSDEQFDNGRFNRERSLPIAYHLDKETKELIEQLERNFDKTRNAYKIHDWAVYDELVDCFMLILDCATHFGLDSEELIKLTGSKLKVNEMRQWGKPDKNGVVEHIRKQE